MAFSFSARKISEIQIKNKFFYSHKETSRFDSNGAMPVWGHSSARQGLLIELSS